MSTHYSLLPEELSMHDQQVDDDREREMKRLNDRIRQLEDEVSRSPRLGLGAAPTNNVFELTPTTIMFGVIIGLVVYIIVSDSKQPKREKQWWEK